MALSKDIILKNRYRIIAPIAEGGFGAVYRAEDTTLQRPCAVKENLQLSAAAQTQFRREASLLAGVNHRALPRVTDHFEENGRQYLVMDFVAGESLATQLGNVGLTTAIDWTRQAAAALSYLHRQTPPIYHRDIKPANIIVQADGRAMLVDFGIAKEIDSADITRAGAQAVTTGYSPPEQYSGTTDARSDVYALGATLFALLTGGKPIDALQRLQGAKIDITALPNAVKPILGKALALAPHERYRTMQEFIAALEGVQIAMNGEQLKGDMQREVVRQPATTAQNIPQREAVAKPDGAGQRKLSPFILIGIGVVILGALAYFLLGGDGNNENVDAGGNDVDRGEVSRDEIDDDGGGNSEPAAIGESVWTISDAISSPAGLATDGELLYVSARNGYHVVDLAGTVQTSVSLNFPLDDLVVLSDGQIVAIHRGEDNSIFYVLDETGRVTQEFSELSKDGDALSLSGLLTIMTDGTDLFVLGANQETGQLYQFDSSGTVVATLPLDVPPFPTAMLGSSPDGTIYVPQGEGRTIERVGSGEPIALEHLPIGVTVGENGDVYVLVRPTTTQVLHYSAAGDLLHTIDVPLDGTPRDIVYVAGHIIVSTRGGISAIAVDN